MGKKIFIFLALSFVVLIPFVFQKKGQQHAIEQVQETLVIITPHEEGIRFEFTQGFKDWYFKKTGKRVALDWRVLGGSQEIFRFLNSQYTNAFELYWTKRLGKHWSEEVRDAFANPKIVLPDDPKDDNLVQSVRRAFLNSNISSGIDILFGGGEIEVGEQGTMGNLVPSGIMVLHPEWFQDSSIPEIVGGTHYWDREGRWVGIAYSGFGIIFNRDVLKQLHYEGEPKQWSDLADPVFFGEIALADPTVSATSNRVFDMMFQQKVLEFLRENNLNENTKANVDLALREGWDRAMKLIEIICANARYFTDSSTKPVLDVSAGDCAVGVSIDFYGLYQEENLRLRSESDRFGFVFPKGGSVPTADVVGMLRGAPDPQLALAFIEYILSLEGQKLWGFKVGTPGGPTRYSLRRPPIRKELYLDEFYEYRSNPELNAYRDLGDFSYHAEWSVPIFKVLRFLIKSIFIDTHKELTQAWKAIINAKKEGRNEDADQAFKVFQNFSLIGYDNIMNNIKPILSSGNALDIIKLQGSLTHHFRKQYLEAEDIAKGL